MRSTQLLYVKAKNMNSFILLVIVLLFSLSILVISRMSDKSSSSNNNSDNYTFIAHSPAAVLSVQSSKLTAELSLSSSSVLSSSSSSSSLQSILSIPVVEQSMDIETHLGIMKCKVYGPIDGIPIITVHGMNIALVNEWSYISRYLSTRGYRVYMLNFHSNDSMKPSSLHTIDFNRIISDIIGKYIIAMDKKEEVILMGKSWGGQSIASYSSSSSIEHTKYIRKVVLIAPGIPKGKKDIVFALGKVQKPVFLGWAKDDMMMSTTVIDIWLKAFEEDADAMNENKQQQQHQQQMSMWLHTYNVESGGHLIFDEYAQPIEQFLLLDH